MSQGGSAPPGLAAQGPREVSMSIPVAPEMEIVATAQAAALGEYLAMTRDKIDEVKLALVEACINAFEHADCRDEQLHLTFRLGQEPKGREWLEVEVLDKGKGFDKAMVEEPSIEKSFASHRKRGWGLQIIKSLMDEVQITSGTWGTRILMRKYK
jgi:serine/threonine-protein kinase RsbW